MNYEKYLPIGTVVLLKNAKKRVMITGFCCTNSKNNKIYDYTGCLYPEGYLTPKNILLFDHFQIDKIYHLGLVDNEEKKFKEDLKAFLQKKN